LKALQMSKLQQRARTPVLQSASGENIAIPLESLKSKTT
jgi:hypothetical protein